MSKIFSLTVCRNEADRYLMPMILHMRDVVDDEMYFYDDRSNDSTNEVLSWAGVGFDIRKENEASFVQNESAFREQAWRSFEQTMKPIPGDWVLVIDCDEVLVSAVAGVDIADTLRQEVLWANQKSIELAIPEVFGFDTVGNPMVRTDGLWGTISAPRLFRYETGGQYYSGPGYGVPAVPSYVMSSARGQCTSMALMHFGYADDRDKASKYARYMNQSGHNVQHVKSILDPPTLVPWNGQTANGMRRARNC